jgi:hypothetical protein
MNEKIETYESFNKEVKVEISFNDVKKAYDKIAAFDDFNDDDDDDRLTPEEDYELKHKTGKKFDEENAEEENTKKTPELIVQDVDETIIKKFGE